MLSWDLWNAWKLRAFLIGGLAVIAMGNVSLAAALLDTDATMRFGLVMGGMLGIGIGAALVQAQLSGAVVALAPSDQSGMASAVTMVMRQAGFAIGIAALGAALRSETVAISYLWPFAVASVASVCGLIAALALLPMLPVRR